MTPEHLQGDFPSRAAISEKPFTKGVKDKSSFYDHGRLLEKKKAIGQNETAPTPGHVRCQPVTTRGEAWRIGSNYTLTLAG